MRRLLLGFSLIVSIVVIAGCAPAAAPSPRPSSPSASPSSSPTPTPTPVDAAAAAVDRMSTTQLAASVVMGHIPSKDPVALHDYMATGLGGFILMGANVPRTPEELKGVTDALKTDPALPPLIAIDQEGGVVSRLPWDRNPAANTLKSASAEEVRRAFAARAELVAAAGANVNFGIVADVPRGTSSFIYSRALGADAASAAQRVPAAVEGEKGTVLSTLKHFPGHGAAPGDSHHGIPHTDETLEQWRAGDATPFVAGIDSGAELLMFGHLAYTAVDAAPASLSARWHEIARKDLGFQGVMITDDLGMLGSSGIAAYRDPGRNAVAALVAGNDMVLMVVGSTPQTAQQIVDAIVRAVGDGSLSEERLKDAALHVMRLRMGLASR